VKQECIFVGQVLLSTYVNNGLLTVHGEYASVCHLKFCVQWHWWTLIL